MQLKAQLLEAQLEASEAAPKASGEALGAFEGELRDAFVAARQVRPLSNPRSAGLVCSVYEHNLQRRNMCFVYSERPIVGARKVFSRQHRHTTRHAPPVNQALVTCCVGGPEYNYCQDVLVVRYGQSAKIRYRFNKSRPARIRICVLPPPTPVRTEGRVDGA